MKCAVQSTSYPDKVIIQHAIWLYLRFTLSLRDVIRCLEADNNCAERALYA